MKCSCCKSKKIRSFLINQNIYYRCGHCGFIDKHKNGEHPKKRDLVHHYDTVDPFERVAHAKRDFFYWALEKLQILETQKKCLLDVGCGNGYFLEMAIRNGWEVTGVEISENAARHSREVIGEGKIFRGTLAEANFKDDSFNAITLRDVLVSSDDLEAEIEECYRLLKRGGKIGIRVRNVLFQQWLYRIYHPFRKIFLRIGVKTPYVFHPNNFTTRSIYLLLHRLGYSNIKISNSPLTRGDPYSYHNISGVVRVFKHLIFYSSEFLWRLSSKRWVTGPSLLIWADKS